MWTDGLHLYMKPSARVWQYVLYMQARKESVAVCSLLWRFVETI